MYIKINNLFKNNGQADYKGFDLEKIISGTQIYPEGENVAFFKYDGIMVEHQDAMEITKAEYSDEIIRYNDCLNTILTPEKQIEQLKQSNEALNATVDMILTGVIPNLLG